MTITTRTSQPAVGREWRLRRRPQEQVRDGDFEMVDAPVPQPQPGQALVQTLYVSLDPASRIWISEREGYRPPLPLGEILPASALSRVVASASDEWQPGDLVYGPTGWREWACIGRDTKLNRAVMSIPAQIARDTSFPLPSLLGVAGSSGITAMVGLDQVAAAQSGETVVVSAASGAVGMAVGQIARLRGCRAVGITSGADKCRWLVDTLGFDAAIDRNLPDWREQLADATPDGVDVNFENVGGAVMEATLARMNQNGRVALCGLISGYNQGGAMAADYSPILMKRLNVRGFIASDYIKLWPEMQTQLIDWVRDGKLFHQATVVEGFEQIPATFNRLFDGDKLGKLLVRVAA